MYVSLDHGVILESSLSLVMFSRAVADNMSVDLNRK